MAEKSPTTQKQSPVAALPGEAKKDGSVVPSSEFETKVAEVIAIVRPAVQADDGDVFLRSANEETGEVEVELVGACVTCPASSQTLKEGLERILQQRVDGVTSVRHVGEDLFGSDDGTPVSL